MVNSDVPHNSNLVSGLHRITCSSSNSVFSSIKQAHDGAVVRADYKLVRFNAASMVKIVQPQSALNDDYSNVSKKFKHILRFRANN